jgi:heat shock protein HslJ
MINGPADRSALKQLKAPDSAPFSIWSQQMSASEPRSGRMIASALIGAFLIAGCATPQVPLGQPGSLPKPVELAPPGAIGEVSVPGPAPAAGTKPAAVGPSLAASSWYWLGTIGSGEFAAPADPDSFNLEFLDGGQLAAQIDCNRGSSSWRQDGSSLRIGPLATTRMACPPGSEATRFGRQLGQVRSAALVRGLLELRTEEAATMVFARDPDWRLNSYDCKGGSPMQVAVGGGQAVVRLRTDSWLLAQQAAGSGQRYTQGNAILIIRGPDANLIVGGKQIAGPCSTRR